MKGVWGRSNLPQRVKQSFLNQSLNPPNQKFLDPPLQWALGDGVNGAKVGIPRPGKIVSGTLSAVSGNNSVGEIRVQFEINGTLRRETTITKPAGEESVVVAYIKPIQVQRNDRTRVRSQTTNRNVSSSTVCILIELD